MTTPEGYNSDIYAEHAAKFKERYKKITPGEYKDYVDNVTRYGETLDDLFAAENNRELLKIAMNTSVIKDEIVDNVIDISFKLLSKKKTKKVIAMISFLTHELNDTYVGSLDKIGSIECDNCIDLCFDTDIVHESIYLMLTTENMEYFIEYPNMIGDLFMNQIEKMTIHILEHATQNM